MPKPGDKLTLISDADHGDWKTAMVMPDRWPTLKAGTEVEFKREWRNVYGTQWSVWCPDNVLYDLDPKHFNASQESRLSMPKEKS